MRVISGQHIASTGTLPAGWGMMYDSIWRETGKYAGLIGINVEGDGWCVASSPQSWCRPIEAMYLNFAPFWVDKAIDHWNGGGVVTVMWSAHNPWNDGTVDDLTGTGGAAMDQLITPGSPVYAKWIAIMEKLAAGLQQFRDANVVVLWRPLHEMNGNQWWGRHNSPASYVRVWQHMFNYLTHTKGLSNLLWVYAPTLHGVDVLATYPGSGYVDIVGFSYYPSTQTFGTHPLYTELTALGKVMAMAEYGYRGPGALDAANVIASIQSSMPLVTYVMFWNAFSDRDYSLGSAPNAAGFMNHPWTVDKNSIPPH